MAEVEPTTNDSNTTDTGNDAAVLSFSPLSPTGSSPPDSSPSTRREVTEPPAQRDVPATIPGLNEMLNEWQISGLPEEQQFFSTTGNVFDAAVRGIKSHFGDTDQNIIKAWLLTEIDHWDLEKERIVVLTTNNLVIVRYNFIQQLVEELKYVPLSSIKKISVGDFMYSYSYGFTRSGTGIKIWWGNDPVSFGAKWNPFSTAVPFTILTSHILIRRNQSSNEILKFDTLPEQLHDAANQYHAQTGASVDVPLVEEKIEFDYYLGLSAMIHNHSFLGFFKKRGAINW